MGTDLEQRVVELETRLAFQEQALAELSDALAATRLEAARDAELLRRAMEALQQSSRDGFYADPADEPPPPHY
jgi:SlyX protein